MLNMRWLLGLALVFSTTLPACTSKTSLRREGGDAGRDAQPATGCTYAPVSVDLSCNDDPKLPTVAGTCGVDGTCTCKPGFLLSPTSKRCKLDPTSDAGAVICTVGADQTCNGDPQMSSIAGTCVGGVACACKTGYLHNPATGKCGFAPVTDAATGQVCTFLLDQTCNDDDTFSGLAGVCQKGFTCACNSGFVLNPATGRCRAGVAPDAAVVPDAPGGKDTGESKDTDNAVADAPVGKDLGKDAPGVCTFGMDQTCNDSSLWSWVAGTCQSNGTCLCASGFVLNASGLCAPLPRDASPDLSKAVCTPGMDQTCNDSPASALWGTCQANGTCSCINGSINNPSTGKCMRPEVSTCSGSFRACGCGCCGEPPLPLCYYPSAGESLSAIKAADDTAKDDPNCVRMGCGLGQLYLCCAEAAAEPAGSAQYSASFTIGAYDRIGLKKTGNDGDCVWLGLVSPSSLSESKPLRVGTPINWGIEAITAGACSTGSTERAIGAQGTVTISPNETVCTISVHVTASFYSVASGTVSSKRIDADNVPYSGGYCP